MLKSHMASATRRVLALSALVLLALAIDGTVGQNQQQQYTTPVPILKQINRQNEDGSYSFGYEAADKSFKIETKYPNGEVYGKYGYVDDSGKVREVEYGASQRGFEPQGSDINVPPPTLNNDNNRTPLGPNEQDDGQYREDPSIYYKSDKYNSLPAPRPASNQRLNLAPRPQQQQLQQPQYQQQQQQPEPTFYRQQPQQQPYYQPLRQQYQQPQQQQPQYQQQQQPQYQQRQSQPYYQQPGNLFQGHPAEHIDINTGSYSLSYTG